MKEATRSVKIVAPVMLEMSEDPADSFSTEGSVVDKMLLGILSSYPIAVPTVF